MKLTSQRESTVSLRAETTETKIERWTIIGARAAMSRSTLKNRKISQNAPH